MYASDATRWQYSENTFIQNTNISFTNVQSTLSFIKKYNLLEFSLGPRFLVLQFIYSFRIAIIKTK